MVAIVSFLWSYIYYSGGLWEEDYTRPFVYRQLVPLLARGIEFLGVPGNIALIVVMTISGVGFYVALHKLASEFYYMDNRQEILLLVYLLASMLILGIFRKHYDLMTACLFASYLYCFWTDKKPEQLLIFALSCLNRETAFLLVLFYGVYLFPMLQHKLRYEIVWMFISQVYLYVLITFALRFIFASTSGSDMWIEPIKNILKFVNQPYRSLLHLLGTLGVLWWMSRDWKQKPKYLRSAFSLLAPTLLVMYVVLGQAFEIRVFWELSPLVIILSLPKP